MKLFSLNDIDTGTIEGRLLIAAIIKLATESQKGKKPSQIIAQCMRVAAGEEILLQHFDEN